MRFHIWIQSKLIKGYDKLCFITKSGPARASHTTNMILNTEHISHMTVQNNSKYNKVLWLPSGMLALQLEFWDYDLIWSVVELRPSISAPQFVFWFFFFFFFGGGGVFLTYIYGCTILVSLSLCSFCRNMYFKCSWKNIDTCTPHRRLFRGTCTMYSPKIINQTQLRFW